MYSRTLSYCLLQEVVFPHRVDREETRRPRLQAGEYHTLEALDFASDGRTYLLRGGEREEVVRREGGREHGTVVELR